MQSFARNVLLEAPLLRRLPKDDLLALASLARLQAYKPRDVIFHQGDPGDSFHVIVGGRVRIVITAPSGGEQTLALLGRGDCFGELAILDGQPRSASALVVESAILIRISREDLRSWLSSRPQAALALLETISLRLRRTNESLHKIEGIVERQAVDSSATIRATKRAVGRIEAWQAQDLSPSLRWRNAPLRPGTY